jgi:broad-specificity NMP kinase
MFAVLLTGPPGAGKTVTLTALSDALVEDGVAHSAVDVDEVAWTYPFPDCAQRCDYLRAWADAHRLAGRDVVLVAEVIETPDHLTDVLAAVGADDHLLVRLDAPPATLRQRVVDREPPGWHGLDFLLKATPRLQSDLAGLGGVHLVINTEQAAVPEVVERIRAARRDRIS